MRTRIEVYACAGLFLAIMIAGLNFHPTRPLACFVMDLIMIGSMAFSNERRLGQLVNAGWFLFYFVSGFMWLARIGP